MTRIEEIFEEINWERKFTHTVPRRFDQVWRESDADEARRTLRRLKGETNTRARCLYLFSDSLGQALAYNDEDWSE